jgi:glucosyl-3-phosphoglycerate phosphatase
VTAATGTGAGIGPRAAAEGGGDAGEHSGKGGEGTGQGRDKARSAPGAPDTAASGTNATDATHGADMADDLNAGGAPQGQTAPVASINPMTGRRVVIWRHGRTPWNLEGRFQGQTDVPLDEVGLAQAKRAAGLLAALNPAAIVASDLQRAVATAETLADLTGLPLTLDKGLRETYAGTWQGKTDAEIQAAFPEEWAAWRTGHATRRGGGETEPEVAERVVQAIHRALEGLAPRGTLVVVSHGGAARVAIGRMLGLPHEYWSSLGGLSNCCWSVLASASRGWRLVEHNSGTLPEPVMGEDQ